jgi:peptidoglycan endopeptidase LytE
LNLFSKKLYLSCAFFVFGLVGLSHASTAEASSAEVKVQVNDSLLPFSDAQPFIDEGSKLQIPLRTLIEQLGYRVDWSMDKQTVTVTVAKDKMTVVLRTGDSTAQINGKPVKLESPAQFIEGKVYLPLRFVSETFGYINQWDNDNRIAIIGTDGLYHAPAWFAPKPKPPILQSAFKFLGVPYVFGGNSPGGFDCSGYVGYVYRLNGIYLPRTSVDMFDNLGQSVANLQEGDLVFFAEGSRTSHVGIYLGNQKFISATSSGGVSVASITTGYWGKRYVGAKRVAS